MSRLTKVSIDSVLYDIGNKGINSYETLSEMLAEPISNLYEGAICWVNQEETYFQWRSSNEIISNYGRYRELEFGSDFQVDDPTIDAADHKDKIIQYIGQDSPDHGFKRGYFYESRMSNVINYVIAEVNSTTTGTFYTYDGVNYTPVVLVGDGTGYVEGTVYYKEQNVEVYTWGNINTFKIEVLDDTTPLVNKTYSSDYIEKNFEAKVEYLTQEEYDNLEESVKTDGTEYRTSDTGIIYKNGVMFGKLVDEDFDEESKNAIMNKTVTAKFDEVREYVDNDLTTALQQYADDLIADVEEVTEDKVWSNSKTKDYVDTTLEDYTKSATEILQADYDTLDEETKLANNYHCTDTGRMYYKGILYGDKKPIELTYEEYKTLEEVGLVEADVDYVVHSNESGVLLGSEDISYKDKTVHEALITLEENVTTLNVGVDKKESVYITNDPSGSGVLYNAAEYLGVNSVDTYGIYNLVVTTDTGESGECNLIYKHRVATYGNIISENGVTFSNLNEYGTIVVDSTSANRTFKVKYLGEPIEDMSGLSKYEYTRANKNAPASEVLKNISKTVTLTFSDYYTTIYPSLFDLSEFSEDAIIQVTTGYYQYVVIVQNITKNNAVLRGWYAKDAASSPVLVSSGSTEAKLTYIGK